MICKQCKQEFEGRADALYCSARCRVAGSRNKEDVLSVTSVTDTAKCNKPKRQTFTDLPLDVQHAIDRISDSPEEKVVRTAIAVDYQAKHPGSQHRGIDYQAEPRGTAKPGDALYQPSGIEEYCCGCNVVLPQLEQPRQHTGACIACVTKGVA